MKRFILLLAMPFVTATHAFAAADCKAVATKDPKQLSKSDFEQCRGPIIAAAACKGWRQGKAETGCKDHRTSIEWAASKEPSLHAKGEACLAGSAMDVQCGL